MRIPFLLLGISLLPLGAEDPPQYTFGTTVIDSSGLEGRIYDIKPGTFSLPKLNKKQPLSTIYSHSLNITPRRFDHGFPGIPERIEWFAIEYTGRFWIDYDGDYSFTLLSDDGSKLFLDNKLVIDNDGIHPPIAVKGWATLSRGIHDIRVGYFQGPRFDVALMLWVTPPGERTKLFDTQEFRPPMDTNEWTPGKISKIRSERNRY